MKDRILIVKSITNAMKSKGILQKHGFDISVERVSMGENSDGCSFAVNIKSGNVNVAETLLSTAGIDVVRGSGGGW